MPKIKKGLSLEEHIKLREKINEIAKLQTEVLNEIWKAYGKSSVVGVVARNVFILRNLERISYVQFELDNCSAREERLSELNNRK